ncbi:hypothetical protein D9619_003706 [Psilocybe cf. subviscida]|uniref:Tat pathway signal sequence n=1 Tax=Psilocybe cf. subviscida TaxID=2480587 RepID=A0A8H5EU29_9AGAR|nr:hypothetical protein D9619_003706 [Psilocybe cf. subviscida]
MMGQIASAVVTQSRSSSLAPEASKEAIDTLVATEFRGSYKPLNDGEKAHVSEKSFSPRLSKTRTRVHFAGLWVFIITQAVVISLLLRKLNQQAEATGVHLYTPAEDVIQYEVKTFNFGIGDDLSPFQQPPSDELDEMWQDLYSFGVHRIPKHQAELLPNKTSAIPGDKDGYYIAELEIFHQLHCLSSTNDNTPQNMVRQALYPDYYPDMRLGEPQADEHIGHCIDAIRQGLMCSADTSTIVWQWDEKQQKNTFRGGVAHTCRNFDLIRDWARDRIITEKYVQEIHMPDDGIQIPTYREDGSTFYS